MKRCLVAIVGIMVTACAPSPGNATATALPLTSANGSPGAGSPSAAQSTSGVRTVLAPLGLNLHSSASVSSTRLGSAAQGVTLTVLGHTSDSGGWYQVQGATQTGWIVADPTLSAAGYFQPYSSTARGFTALYPQNWTFAEEASDVVFRPQQGSESVVVTGGASVAALAPVAPQGYTPSASTSVVVCGVTANLVTYDYHGTASPSPAIGTAQSLPHRQTITLALDASHFMLVAHNYSDTQGEAYADFYNSMTFAFPQCEQTPSPAASATP